MLNMDIKIKSRHISLVLLVLLILLHGVELIGLLTVTKIRFICSASSPGLVPIQLVIILILHVIVLIVASIFHKPYVTHPLLFKPINTVSIAITVIAVGKAFSAIDVVGGVSIAVVIGRVLTVVVVQVGIFIMTIFLSCNFILDINGGWCLLIGRTI
ncbi:hypothetical protein RchiOBHm_Chr2g0127191 [Rosa chinensis]|uniref:Uncharacterized protein n=1 Tax=Rosa chinensis TaxID=74649 RepID=A0A2P6RU11_ROSCH|nr:hypothetical protein RchiOBHm_Chr2g0127191 [Rosa chinensis]